MFFKIVSIILVSLPSAIFACATCYGDPNDPATQGMNWAIITLLGVTGSVLAGVGSVILKLKKKADKFSGKMKEKQEKSTR